MWGEAGGGKVESVNVGTITTCAIKGILGIHCPPSLKNG